MKNAQFEYLETYHLVVQRDLVLEGGEVIEHRTVRPANRGRRIGLTWSDADRPLGQVIKIDSDRIAPPARPWIAKANGEVVESTFDLVAGWDPTLEGQTDATYSRVNNTDFAAYANVYRFWVLNEDGYFSFSPYNQGPGFDLGGIFGRAAIRPQPLRFLDCLTFDDVGQRRMPIVEISIDAGQNWTSYPGVWRQYFERAAIYLDDATLPSSFLNAAKTGDVRLRVTASLQSPVPVEVVRWKGNPFAGTVSPRHLHVGATFLFSRVLPNSIHFSGIKAGDLSAQLSDDHSKMQQWLIKQMRRVASIDVELGRATLTLGGAWPMLRIGDHLIDAGGQGLDLAGHSEAIDGRAAAVCGLQCRWSDIKAPITIVDLTFC